jgi:transcriptional regulator with XRE-family HTH domain
VPTPGGEIRAVRTRAGLSLAEVARRANLSVGCLSRLENDRHLPTWSTLARVAAALECEPQLKLVAARSSIAAMQERLGRMTPEQRLSAQDPDPTDALWTFAESGIRFVVGGAVAALIQGLPMVVDRVVILMPDDDEALAQLADLFLQKGVLFRDVDLDELRSLCEEAIDRPWCVRWCDVVIRLVEELPAAVDVSVGGMSLPLLPIADLLADDPDVAHVVEVIQAAPRG